MSTDKETPAMTNPTTTERPRVALEDLRPDQAIVQDMLMKSLGPKLRDTKTAAKLQSGDPDMIIGLLRDIFKDRKQVRRAYSDAAEDQLDELMAQLGNETVLRSSMDAGLKVARVKAIDGQLADVVKLMMMAPKYRTLFVADIAWRVMPALVAGQFQFKIDQQGTVVAFISWAWVSDEVKARARDTSTFRLKEDEWRSGTNLIIMDVVSPQGHEAKLAKEMAEALTNPAAPAEKPN